MTNKEIDAIVLRYVRENPGKRLATLIGAIADAVPQPRHHVPKALQRLRRAGKVRSDGSYWLPLSPRLPISPAQADALIADNERILAEYERLLASPSSWQSTPPTAEQVRASIEAFRACGNPDFDPGYAPWWCRRDGSPRIVDLTVEMDVVCLFEDGEPITMRHFGTEGEWMPVALPPRMETAQ